MTNPFESLLAALDGEATTMNRLVVCCRDERELLVAGDVNGLNENLGRQRGLLEELSQVEITRKAALSEWAVDAAAAAAPPPPPSLRKIIALAPPETAERLEAIRQALVASSEELQTLARANYFLALKGLEFVDATAQVLAGTVAQATTSTYGIPGRPHAPRAGAVLVDRKV